MRARIFTLENELDRLKTHLAEKDQLSDQVHFDNVIIVLFNNAQTLKFKARQLKSETSKMDRNPPITTQERDLSNPPKCHMCFLRGP